MDTYNNKSLKNVCCGIVYETALPDMIIITCAFSKGHKLCTAIFFTGVKKKQNKKQKPTLIFLHHLFPFF